MKPILVLKQDVFTQIGPFQVPLSVGGNPSLMYQRGPDRLEPHESFTTLDPQSDTERLAELGAPTTLSGKVDGLRGDKQDMTEACQFKSV